MATSRGKRLLSGENGRLSSIGPAMKKQMRVFHISPRPAAKGLDDLGMGLECHLPVMEGTGSRTLLPAPPCNPTKVLTFGESWNNVIGVPCLVSTRHEKEKMGTIVYCGGVDGCDAAAVSKKKNISR
ncbi:unnamed protein product, partial [Choristocarpus tenellus]